MTDDTLVYFGDAVKALGGGKVGGVVAPFGSPDATDSQNEYFHKNTDFGLDISAKARVVYHHGFDRDHGRRRYGVADLSVGAGGVEGVAVLDVSTPAAKALYGRAEAGALYWSSGSARHLVETAAVEGATRIDAWPIIEVSLTPTPVDRRARAYALKSLIDEAVPAESLLDRSGRVVSSAQELLGLFDDALKARESEGRSISADKRDAVKALADAFAALWRRSDPGRDRRRLAGVRAAWLRHALD